MAGSGNAPPLPLKCSHPVDTLDSTLAPGNHWQHLTTKCQINEASRQKPGTKFARADLTLISATFVNSHNLVSKDWHCKNNPSTYMPPMSPTVTFTWSNRKHSCNECVLFYQNKEHGALLMSSNVEDTLLDTIYPFLQGGLWRSCCCECTSLYSYLGLRIHFPLGPTYKQG